MKKKPDPRALLNNAINLINSGQTQVAVALCREAIQQNPGDVSMTALLGATLLKSRESGEAEKYLRRAIDLAPTFAKPHEDLGFLLVEMGRPDEAIEILQKALRLDAKSEQAFFALGRALSMTGQGAQADTAFEASFELNPERKKLAHAAEHHKAGRIEDAQRFYREILRANPRNVDAMRLSGGVLMKQTHVEEAEGLFRRAISIAPDYSLAILDLGRLLMEQHRYAEAIDCFQRLSELEPNTAKPQFMLAAALAPIGRTFDALDAYRRAIELRPEHAGAWLGLGHTLKTVGRQSEAIDAYRQCISARPDNGEAYWSLCNLKTYQLTVADIQEMEAAITRTDDLNDQSMVNFLFALAKASEDKGDFEVAWGYYTRGNKQRRMLEHYDPVQTEVFHDEIIEVFDAPFLRKYTGQGHPDPSPIFVVGLPRSGSTLIEQILASHSAVEGTSELPYLGRAATSLNRNRADGLRYPRAVRELQPAHFKVLGQQYLDQANLHRFGSQVRFIDKMPNNFPTIGLLHLILPHAKIIDARRNPLDSTLSCYRQLFAKGQSFVYDLTEIGEYYLQYQRMMDYWHEVLPGRILTVQYEEMVTDFETQVRRLLEYCELPWEDACLRFHETERPVRTASSEQVRRPVYRDSVNFWRNYAPWLDELVEVLEPVLCRYEQYEYINRIQ